MQRRLWSIHAVRACLATRPSDLAIVYIVEPIPHGPLKELGEAARRAGVTVEGRPRAYLDSLADGGVHQGVVAIAGSDYPYVDLEVLLAAPAPGLIVALDEITDPHNLGAIVRSAVALGAYGVITLKDRAAPVTPVVVRASAGATEHARIARVTNLVRALDALAARDFRIVGLASEGPVELSGVDLTGPVVLVVGSEGSGLRRLVRTRCDVLASIPLTGLMPSLNASVAAGVALYEVVRQRTVAVTAE